MFARPNHSTVRICLFWLLGTLLAVSVWTLLAMNVRADEAPDAPKPESPKHTLRYKFRAGETIRTKVLHQVLLSTTISGSKQDAETISGSVKVWKVLDADKSGQCTFVHSVESVDMCQKLTGRQEITYNSEKDKQAPPGYEMVAQSIGIPLTEITMDASGKVLKREEKRSNAPAHSESNQMVMPLPEGPIAVGESWDVPHDVPITLEDRSVKLIKTRQHYTLEKVSNGVATIAVATQVLTPVNNPKIQSQLIQRLTKGTIRFDIDAGRVLSQELELDERVLGFQGADSSLHYLGRFTEEYIQPESKSASKPQLRK